MLNPTWLPASLAAAVGVAGGVTIYVTTNNAASATPAATTSSSTGSAAASPQGNGNGPGSNNGNGNSGGSNPGHPIGVSWTIDAPLQPGRLGVLAATIDNQNNQAITVQTVSVVVNSADKAGCNKAWLTVGSFSGARSVAANSPTTINLDIKLNDNTSNQNACKSAKFNLTVSATAVGS